MGSEQGGAPRPANQTVVVRFEAPVEGVDPTTGDRFTSDRHLVVCSDVHQTAERTRFVADDGVEVACWPTAKVQSIRWPPPSIDDHETPDLSHIESIEEPASAEDGPDLEKRATGERRLDRRLDHSRLWARAPVEVTPPELAGWDDISEKTLALGNQTGRARHWDAAPRNAREQCPICGDRLVTGRDHPCNR